MITALYYESQVNGISIKFILMRSVYKIVTGNQNPIHTTLSKKLHS
ncbi:SUSD1 isoform 10, partial [Pongo abelii]